MAHLGWGPVVTAFAACVVAAFWLRKRESGSAAPMPAMDLFRIRLFPLSAATAICAFAVQGLKVVVMPFLLTFERGILATARLLGQAIGAAAVAFRLSRRPEGGALIAIWFGVSLAVLGSLISLLRLFPMARQR